MSKSFLFVDGCFCSMNTGAKNIWNITTFSYYKLAWYSKVDSFIASSTFFENWLESLGKQGYTPFYKNDNLNFLSRVSDYSYKTVKNHSGDLHSSVSTRKAFPLQVLIMLKIISYSKKIEVQKSYYEATCQTMNRMISQVQFYVINPQNASVALI